MYIGNRKATCGEKSSVFYRALKRILEQKPLTFPQNESLFHALYHSLKFRFPNFPDDFILSFTGHLCIAFDKHYISTLRRNVNNKNGFNLYGEDIKK